MKMTAGDRQLIRLMGQVLDDGWLNPDNRTFTAGAMAEAIADTTGHRPDVRHVGALLDRMGVASSSRYRRSMQDLIVKLPAWVEGAELSDTNRVKFVPPSRV